MKKQLILFHTAVYFLNKAVKILFYAGVILSLQSVMGTYGFRIVWMPGLKWMQMFLMLL